MNPTNKIHIADHLGWVDDATKLVQIRELGNLIAHEYAAGKMAEIYTAVTDIAPEFLATISRVVAYADELKEKHSFRG